jgi:hypothetical protein
MKNEVIEIRRLIAKAANYISSASKDQDFIQKAQRARSMVHENADPRTVLLGVRHLENLLEMMEKNNLKGTENLHTELKLFKENSIAVRESQTNSRDDQFSSAFDSLFGGFVGVGAAEIDETVTPEIIQSAQNILAEFQLNWEIGPYQMPMHPEIETPPKAERENLFAAWSDSAYLHVRQCIEIFSCIDESFRTQNFFSIDDQSFKIIALASQLALEAKDAWAPPFIRLLIVAAQELRRGGSSGMHGPERLAAKLRVGKLIGELSQYDLQNALFLADLTIESISFSRAQILYANEHHPEVLHMLTDRWRQDKHPLYGDIIAQGYTFLGEQSQAYEVLKAAKEHLHTAQDRNYSTERGEYFVKRYTEHLEDIYLARLCRTMAMINCAEGLSWCDEIATPNIRIAGYLSIFWSAANKNGFQADWRIGEIKRIIMDSGFMLDDFWLPVYQLKQLPYLKYYPDFPAERWRDLLENPFISIDSILDFLERGPKEN